MTNPLRLSLLPVLALGLACGGTHPTGDHAGQVNFTLQILPAVPTVVAGQTLQLQVSSPWSADALWSVQPSSAGTIDASGLFTASSTPGTCTVIAVWPKDVRYTASATLRIYPPPVPAVSTPSYTQTSGTQQTTPTGGIANGNVVGESVPATTSRSADGTLQVRHGFTPPPPH